MDLKELALVDPDEHWYYQSKLFALRQALSKQAVRPRRFVDVGAGSGFFSVALADFAAGDQVVCVDPNYEVERVEREGALSFVREAPEGAVASANVLLFIDVLEHVPSDQELLRSYVQDAPAGAYVLITVPAFMSMWSAHDTYLEHYRRYRLEEVVETAQLCGLEVVHRQYLFGSIFPLAWPMRRIRRNATARTDLKPMPSWINSALTHILVFEHRMQWNPVAGVSAFVVARVR